MEELLSRHKKELKTFESDQRQDLKKIKGTCGKSQKGKDLIAAAEVDWATREKDMIRRHEQEIASWKEINESTDKNSRPINLDGNDVSSSSSSNMENIIQDHNIEDHHQPISSAPTSKKVRKRIQQRKQQLNKEAEIANSIANAGPTLRELENKRLLELYLSPIQHTIYEIKADGNCLYRAVAHQIEYLTKEPISYLQIRDICANTLMNNPLEYEPFVEYIDGVGDFDAYCEKVRNSNDWGGHIELRALAKALKRIIIVYSADSVPLHICPDDNVSDEAYHNDTSCLRLSFHQSFYVLGEHYNSVVRL